MSKRLEYVRGIFDDIMNRIIGDPFFVETERVPQGFTGLNVNPGSIYLTYAPFSSFRQDYDTLGKNENKPTLLASLDDLFDYLVFFDPTDRKKYVQWYIQLLKEYHEKTEADIKENGNMASFFSSPIYYFFEDLPKIAESVEKYEYLKLTKVFGTDEKQINRFKDYKEFLKLIKPFLERVGHSNVHTLDHKELSLLKDPNSAVIFVDTPLYIVVHTKTKEANVEFGKYTSWCTSGTRWGSMFDNYNNKGPLFVLIRRGCGSKDAIQRDPTVRLQFHFETKSFMDAMDRPVNVGSILAQDEILKRAFLKYFKEIQKKVVINQEWIKFALSLGFGSSLIDILVDIGPKSLDLSNSPLDMDLLNKLDKIHSLEILKLCGIGLTKLPESIRHLKNLKELIIKENTDLVKIPYWINELTELNVLDASNCNISSTLDISGLVNLRRLSLDINPNITELPIGLGGCQKLFSLQMSYCDLKTVNLPGELNNLEVFDIHENVNLASIGDGVVLNTPKLKVLALTGTKINGSRIVELNALVNRRGLTIVYF